MVPFNRLPGVRLCADYPVLAMVLILIAMSTIELSNTVRILHANQDNLSFPYGYVSHGVYSIAAFTRRADDHNTDIDPVLTSTAKLARGDSSLYSQFSVAGSSFIYPPSSSVILLPAGILVNACSGDTVFATKLYDLVSRFCIISTIVISCIFFRKSNIGFKRYALTVGILLAFFLLRSSVICVQVQSLITLLIAVGIINYAFSKYVTSGILLSMAMCLKPHLALLILFGLIRKKWRFCIAMLATILLVFLLSLMFVGFEP